LRIGTSESPDLHLGFFGRGLAGLAEGGEELGVRQRRTAGELVLALATHVLVRTLALFLGGGGVGGHDRCPGE
jgi:hypothetical protein